MEKENDMKNVASFFLVGACLCLLMGGCPVPEQSTPQPITATAEIILTMQDGSSLPAGNIVQPGSIVVAKAGITPSCSFWWNFNGSDSWASVNEDGSCTFSIPKDFIAGGQYAIQLFVDKSTVNAIGIVGCFGFGAGLSTSSDIFMVDKTIIVSPTPPAKVNHAPTANDLSLTTAFQTAVAANLTGSDPDGDALTFSVVSNTTHGNLTGTAPALTYTPNNAFSGQDSFIFKVNDGKVDSNIAHGEHHRRQCAAATSAD